MPTNEYPELSVFSAGRGRGRPRLGFSKKAEAAAFFRKPRLRLFFPAAASAFVGRPRPAVRQLCEYLRNRLNVVRKLVDAISEQADDGK
ncbi:unnamed protein product [Caenorhabditis brenneri]